MKLSNEIDHIRQHGLPMIERPFEIRIPNAREVLKNTLDEILGNIGESTRWIPEYEQIAEWLSDNQQKGLFVYGNCGRGKTLVCRYALPAIILKHCGKVLHTYDMQELSENLDELKKKKLIGIDDAGSEIGESVKFGERRDPFSEIVDNAEKKGVLLVITSNLNKDRIIKKYEARTFDRIVGTCKRVLITGESLRK